METRTHRLSHDYSSTLHTLTSLHFGTPADAQPGQIRAGKKVYIQAALHADEIPPLLVAHHLRHALAELEAQGALRGEVILVPAANPIGLSQAIMGTPFGRYDLSTGINFNRAYRHVAEELKTTLQGKLGPDPDQNVATIRQHALAALDNWVPCTDADVLKKTLLTLALDADIVLDLHCDNQAVLHLYAGTPLAGRAMPLAALLGAHAVLLAYEGGGEPFDEACSRLWWDLAEFAGRSFPVPMACLSTTVELRGERDVHHDLARQDCQALLDFLALEGVIDRPVPALPQALCAPTPLEGVEPISAPHAGVLVFQRQLGDTVKTGDLIADLIEPSSGHVTQLKASVDGVLFASTAWRHVLRGMAVCKIAGAVPYRAGNLLSQ
jgi:hypothetical protein